MPRIVILLSTISLIVAAATTAVQAQAPAGGMQSITSSAGYVYQVPADWQQVPSSLTQRLGSQVFNVDGEAASADGSQHTHVEAATGFGISAASLGDVLTGYFSVPPGGTDGGPSLSVFSGPSAVQVPGAEAAQAGAATYSDANGAPRVIAARVALRGQTAYLLTVDVTQDFYSSDPNFGRIINSFQVSPNAGPVSAPGA